MIIDKDSYLKGIEDFAELVLDILSNAKTIDDAKNEVLEALTTIKEQKINKLRKVLYLR